MYFIDIFVYRENEVRIKLYFLVLFVIEKNGNILIVYL